MVSTRSSPSGPEVAVPEGGTTIVQIVSHIVSSPLDLVGVVQLITPIVVPAGMTKLDMTWLLSISNIVGFNLAPCSINMGLTLGVATPLNLGNTQFSPGPGEALGGSLMTGFIAVDVTPGEAISIFGQTIGVPGFVDDSARIFDGPSPGDAMSKFTFNFRDA
jgi:hypothetical protein